jgi:hypothetical protein
MWQTLAVELGLASGRGGPAKKSPCLRKRGKDRWANRGDYWLSERPAPFGAGLVTAPPAAAGAPEVSPRPSAGAAPACTFPLPDLAEWWKKLAST